ncbi:MAG: hypothetical protein ACO1O1_02440 [Adhaeribacter sp.]
MKYYPILVCLLALVWLHLFVLPTELAAHGKVKHGKNKAASAQAPQTPATKTDTAGAAPAAAPADTAAATGPAAKPAAVLTEANQNVHASLADFPHIHPLIVHFPIMLLLIAAAMQFLNILFQKTALNWAVLVMVLLGFISAYAATHWSHPHTDGLTAHAELVLEQHDKYADYTIYLSGLGLLAQLLVVFVFRGKRWSVALAAFLLIGAAYAVTMAGHYGAQLVHIEGVGPQGQYLEQHHH